MTEHPVPPDHPGAGDRPYDPQYSYPQYPRFADDTPPAAPQSATAGGSPQPPGNRTGKVIAAAVAAVAVIGVVLAVVVLTGTSTPKTVALPVPTDTSGSASAPADPPSSVAPDPGSSLPGGLPSDRAGLQRTTAATVVGIQYFSALESQDADELVPFVCAGATAAAADDVDQIVFAEPTGPAYVTGAQATMTGDVELDDGTDYELELTLAAQQTGTGWCVQSGAKR